MNRKHSAPSVLSSILSVFMAFSLILGMVFYTQTDIHAKSTKGMKVTFHGKSITLNTKAEPKTHEEVEKKWGEKTRLAGDDEEYAGSAYVWEKGKSKVIIRQPSKEVSGEGEYLGYISIEIGDKNISVAGVKVGMKRAKALKKLQKIYGKDSVRQTKEGKTYTVITADMGEYMPVSFELKNDVVSSIYWMRS